MNIIDPKLKFPRTRTKRKATTKIVIHHPAAATMTVEQIHKLHCDPPRNWNGIGYNLYVRKNGDIFLGRGIEYAGAHCTNHNNDSIGICFEGNYETTDTTMPAAQYQAGVWLIKDMIKRYPTITTIAAHRELGLTVCPGRYFPFRNMVVEAKGAEPVGTPQQPTTASTMKISQKGIDLIKNFEGLRLAAYLCPAKIWTIGYGTTKYPDGKAVKSGDTCTLQQAEQYLKNDCARFENNVRTVGGYLNLNQNEFDALVSFAYNIGSINQLTQNGTRTKKQVADSIPLYNKGGGVVLQGLVRRRAAEQALFLIPIGNVPATPSTPPNTPPNAFTGDLRAALKLGDNATASSILAATVTVGRAQNSKSASVIPIQRLLKQHGYNLGTSGTNKDGIDGSFGALSEAATKLYQRDIVKLKTPDGVWTGKTGASYRKALGIS